MDTFGCLDAMDHSEKINIDLTYLFEISGNDKEEIKGFIDDALQLARESLVHINTAFESGDRHKLRDTAHKLKSGIRIFGDNIVSETVTALEKDAYLSPIYDLRPLVERINQLLPAWQDQLCQCLNDLP